MKAHGSFGSLSRLAGGVFEKDATTFWGRAFQFFVNAALGTFVSITIIKIFFPDLLGHGSAPAVAASVPPATQEGLYGLSCGCRSEDIT